MFDETIARLVAEGALSTDDDPASEPTEEEAPPAPPRRNALVFLPSPHEHDPYPV